MQPVTLSMVVVAHPPTGRFVHALAEAVTSVLVDAGHDVRQASVPSLRLCTERRRPSVTHGTNDHHPAATPSSWTNRAGIRLRGAAVRAPGRPPARMPHFQTRTQSTCRVAEVGVSAVIAFHPPPKTCVNTR